MTEDEMRRLGYTGGGLLGYGEDEVRVSHVWEDRGGEN